MKFNVISKGYRQGVLYDLGDTFEGDEDTPEASWYERADGKKSKKKKNNDKKAKKSNADDGVGVGDVEEKAKENLEDVEVTLEDAFNDLDPTDDNQWNNDGDPNILKINQANGTKFVKGDLTEDMTRQALAESKANG